MPQEEIWNTRDRSYSAWHRRNSTRRFVGIERAQTLAMIDLDASLYVEYDDGTKEPLALIETAVDNNQDYKNATVTCKLARRADLPCYVVLYKLSDQLLEADPFWHDIQSFRVKQLYPKLSPAWVVYTPEQYAKMLVQLREHQAAKLDESFDEINF